MPYQAYIQALSNITPYAPLVPTFGWHGGDIPFDGAGFRHRDRVYAPNPEC